MKKIASYFLILGFLPLFSISCQKAEVEPEPFAVINAAEEKYGIYNFDARASQNAITFFWDLGNGKTETSPNFLFGYDQNGTYQVRLRVTSAGGKTAETTQMLVVKGVRGLVSFYTDGGFAGGIDVWVDGVSAGHLGNYYPTGEPACGADNTARVFLTLGTHAVTAKQSVATNARTWAGNIEVTNSSCQLIKLPK